MRHYNLNFKEVLCLKKKFISIVVFLSTVCCIFLSNVNCYAVNNSPKLSVVIPIYNVEDYAQECLESIVKQSYKNLEIICVNDGSTDNSKSIVEKCAKKDDRIILINQNNSGVSEARNNGIERASGDYITFVDSDDLLELNAYETAMNVFEKEDIDLLVWGYRVFPFSGTWYEKAGKVHGKCYKSDSINAYFNEKSSTVVWNKIYKSNLIKGNYIRFKKGLKYGEDINFNLLVFPKAKNIEFISDKLYNYRIKREGSATTAFGRKTKLKNEFVMFENAISDWNKFGHMEGNESKIVSHFINLAYNEIKALNGEDLKSFSSEFMKLIGKYIKKGSANRYPLKILRKIKYIRQSANLM